MWLVDGLMREQLLVIDDQVEEHQQQRHKTEKKYHSSHVSHHVHATTWIDSHADKFRGIQQTWHRRGEDVGACAGEGFVER